MIDKGTFESLKGYKRMQSPNMTIFDSGYIVCNKGKIVNEKMYCGRILCDSPFYSELINLTKRTNVCIMNTCSREKTNYPYKKN